jgi:hypothetical protein
MRKRVALVAVGLIVVAAILVFLGLPARSIPLAPPGSRPVANVVAGAFHVHTNRSDGAGSVDDVAAAAARAGLQFVVLTDHGDGTRAPDPPAYRAGVLILDGVEISTSGGHYAAIGMQQAPYPLAGEPRDVVEDVSRLNGFGVVSHGWSAKPELQWRDWPLPFDALEWLNLDSEWRDEPRLRLASRFALYPFRQPEVLASLASRPASTFQRWDALLATRRIVALAATDAHAQIAWRNEGALRLAVPVPSYESCFRTISTRLELDAPLAGDAARDGASVLAAIRAGHHYTAVDALATPPAFEFRARVGDAFARQGDTLPVGESVAINVRAVGPEGAKIVLLRDGKPIDETTNPRLTYLTTGSRATYRVEVQVPNAPGRPPVPWIVSNPIHVGAPAAPLASAAPSTTEQVDLLQREPDAWRHEQDPTSLGEVIRAGPSQEPALTFRFALGRGAPANQFAALVKPATDALRACDRLLFRARASRPLRLSVQLRGTGSQDPPRWQRSVYLDTAPRSATVFFNDMHRVGAETTAPISPAAIGSLILLVDTTNSAPGTRGDVAFSELACAR